MKLKLASFQWKSLKYLFWLGPVFVVMGLSAAAVLGGWDAVPVGLLTTGLVILALWLLFEGPGQAGFWGRRSTQVGTNALIATLAVLVILGLVNVLAVRYSARIDLTENQIFTLAPQSQEVMRSLTQPIKAWVFMPTPNPGDRELLENYRRQNAQFSYEYVDPDAKPGVAQRFEVKSIGEVHLEAGNQRRLVQTINPEQRLSERRLTNGIAQMTSDRFEQKLYFVQGHGERALTAGQGGFSQANSRLGDEGFTATPLDLAQEQTIPEDAAVVVIAGAQRPLIEKEITALREFQKQKSGLLLLVDPETNPGLAPLLQDWGVQISDRLVVDPAGQASGLGPGVTIVNQYADHPITKDFGNGISFFPLARPIATTVIPNVQNVPLLYTSDQAQAQQIDKASGNLKFDAAKDPPPPYTLGVALSRSVSADAASGTTPPADPQSANPQARMVVIGNSSFATDGLFEQQLNGDLFLNAVSWLSQRDDQVLAIRPREATNRRIVLSTQQQMSVALFSMALLPAIGFGGAAIVWWKRR